MYVLYFIFQRVNAKVITQYAGCKLTQIGTGN